MALDGQGQGQGEGEEGLFAGGIGMVRRPTSPLSLATNEEGDVGEPNGFVREGLERDLDDDDGSDGGPVEHTLDRLTAACHGRQHSIDNNNFTPVNTTTETGPGPGLGIGPGQGPVDEIVNKDQGKDKGEGNGKRSADHAKARLGEPSMGLDGDDGGSRSGYVPSQVAISGGRGNNKQQQHHQPPSSSPPPHVTSSSPSSPLVIDHNHNHTNNPPAHDLQPGLSLSQDHLLSDSSSIVSATAAAIELGVSSLPPLHHPSPRDALSFPPTLPSATSSSPSPSLHLIDHQQHPHRRSGSGGQGSGGGAALGGIGRSTSKGGGGGSSPGLTKVGLDPSAVSDFFTRLVDDNHSSNHSNTNGNNNNGNKNMNNNTATAGVAITIPSSSPSLKPLHTPTSPDRLGHHDDDDNNEDDLSNNGHRHSHEAGMLLVARSLSGQSIMGTGR